MNNLESNQGNITNKNVLKGEITDLAKKKILLVEDEKDIAQLVKFHLESSYDVTIASSGEQGLAMAEEQTPDLVLLDLMLPEIDGLEVCRQMRQTGAGTENTPIIMVTAKGSEQDIVRGLDMGADDYVVKPFSPKVLVARVNAVLRRNESEAPATDTLQVYDISIDIPRHEVTREGKKLELTYSEFEILLFLAKKPGWVFTRNQIVDAVRGQNYAVTERSIDVHIVGLRKKLGESGQFIETIRGVGYRLKE